MASPIIPASSHQRSLRPKSKALKTRPAPAMPNTVNRFDVTHPGIRRQNDATIRASSCIKKFCRRRSD
jgi:hypothetical protein